MKIAGEEPRSMIIGEETFLGRGWAFPPRFSPGGGEVATVAGALDIRESLSILFATEPGERVMREDYGCALRRLLFEEVDQALLTRIRSMIGEAILYHEPRIEVDRLDVTESALEPGLLTISLYYTIRGTNSRYNFVFPFYLKEASAPR
jgi:phage baseplate assembly protein W